MPVDEITKNISLTVFRDKGTYGDVSIFYYAQSTVEGTTMGIDFKITPQVYHLIIDDVHGTYTVDPHLSGHLGSQSDCPNN